MLRPPARSPDRCRDATRSRQRPEPTTTRVAVSRGNERMRTSRRPFAAFDLEAKAEPSRGNESRSFDGSLASSLPIAIDRQSSRACMADVCAAPSVGNGTSPGVAGCSRLRIRSAKRCRAASDIAVIAIAAASRRADRFAHLEIAGIDGAVTRSMISDGDARGRFGVDHVFSREGGQVFRDESTGRPGEAQPLQFSEAVCQCVLGSRRRCHNEGSGNRSSGAPASVFSLPAEKNACKAGSLPRPPKVRHWSLAFWQPPVAFWQRGPLFPQRPTFSTTTLFDDRAA